MTIHLLPARRLVLLPFLCLALISCGGKGVIKQDAPAPDTEPVTQAPKPAAKPGGYYLDDGPGENPPPDIDSIPDAVPRAEILLGRANLPYSALGKRYVPSTEYRPYKERGLASWYGKRYHGRKTSSGEVYDMYGMTGAHTTLPLPSYVRVTNVENGRSVVVRINDRGPFHDDRIIDLSYAAAHKLRLVEKGSGMVEVEAIDVSNSAMLKPVTSTQAEPGPAKIVTSQVPPPPPVPQGAAMDAPGAQQNPPITGDYVQVGAFKYKNNADALIGKLRNQGLSGGVPVESWYNAGTYRVRLGPFASRQEAEKTAENIRRTLKTSAILIRQ